MESKCDKCPECGVFLAYLLSKTLEKEEIIKCPSCGTDLVVSDKGNLVVLQIEGEDWGE